MNELGTAGRARCTPPAAAELFEIVVLDPTAEDGQERWHTIGWGVDRGDADDIAQTYVTRHLCPYDEARIRHNGRFVGEHRRPSTADA
ncbi:hypothetical protein SAMN05444920_12458 [Nonomuraea solani]|uniref:Uncharacterized protein n=1 Tax=Nonomuraea solani TaxID=1144553 RepID=A0A1H6EXI5_9ACTN|nr:hypothetical protein [Nonomuraea solani]SEH02123.1 hypothetical protein SAMN05444920_12458 [Nonomuraea solani]